MDARAKGMNELRRGLRRTCAWRPASPHRIHAAERGGESPLLKSKGVEHLDADLGK
ncbi:MAG: hypothetical protein IPH63_17620 [Flavobacteriales bacterium]|nr:hypothetical protein [Flavobacteriales bacterium]